MRSRKRAKMRRRILVVTLVALGIAGPLAWIGVIGATRAEDRLHHTEAATLDRVFSSLGTQDGRLPADAFLAPQHAAEVKAWFIDCLARRATASGTAVRQPEDIAHAAATGDWAGAELFQLGMIIGALDADRDAAVSRHEFRRGCP